MHCQDPLLLHLSPLALDLCRVAKLSSLICKTFNSKQPSRYPWVECLECLIDEPVSSSGGPTEQSERSIPKRQRGTTIHLLCSVACSLTETRLDRCSFSSPRLPLSVWHHRKVGKCVVVQHAEQRETHSTAATLSLFPPIRCAEGPEATTVPVAEVFCGLVFVYLGQTPLWFRLR